jgi:hypothetical protein
MTDLNEPRVAPDATQSIPHILERIQQLVPVDCQLHCLGRWQLSL